MAKFFGLKPNSKARRTIDDFENQTTIRLDNRRLLGKVYADIGEDQWAVSIAYNLAMDPGLYGKENDLEVKYSYVPESGEIVQRLETGLGQESPISAVPFTNPNDFVVWALQKEKALAHPA